MIMADDLVLGKDEVNDSNLDEVEVELTTRSEYIQAAYFAISSVEGVDTGLLSKEAARRIRRIIRKSIDIIDDCITELHDELFEPEPDEDD